MSNQIKILTSVSDTFTDIVNSDDGYQNVDQTGTSGSASNYGYESDGNFY